MLNERQSQILETLRRQKRMSVSAISKRFYICEMTVRRDLKVLEDEGCIQRYRGGAIAPEEGELAPVKLRKYLHAKQKAALAEKTKPYLHDRMNVFIDSSSTCLYLIPLLSEYKQIHVITNSVLSLLAAAERNLPCTLVGGDYFKRDMCTVGSIAEEFLRPLNVDAAFFSSEGLSDDGLITDSDELQNAVRRIVMANSPVNVLLLDSHKCRKKYLYTLCRTEDVTEMILL